MHRQALLAMALLFSSSFCFSPSAAQQCQRRGEDWYTTDATGHEWRICPGRIFVRFKPEVSSTQQSSVLSEHGLSRLDAAPLPGGGYRCAYDTSRVPPGVLEEVRGDSAILDTFLDTYLEFFSTNDTYYVNQWSLRKARVDKAWPISTGSDDVVVAVIDQGFELGHEDLASDVYVNQAEAEGTPSSDDDGNGYADDVNGWDFASGDNDPSPAIAGDEHGTAVAGIVCAVRNNGKGVAGAAGGNNGGGARLLALRVNTALDVSPAIDYAWRMGADIINMSFPCKVNVSIPADVAGKRLDSVLLEFAVDATPLSPEDSVVVTPEVGAYPLTAPYGSGRPGDGPGMNQQPVFEDVVPSSRPVASGDSRLVRMDITDIVRDWMANPGANYGLVIGSLKGPQVASVTLREAISGGEASIRITFFYQNRFGDRISSRQ